MTKYNQLKDGEWQRIKDKKHRIACCDCGLVHDLEFRIIEGDFEFRAYMNNRATGQRRRYMSKKKKQQKHAKRRFKERFDIRLHKALKQSIVKQIQAGKAKPVRKRSLRITLFELSVDDTDIIVVYDSKRKEIVTGWLKP